MSFDYRLPFQQSLSMGEAAAFIAGAPLCHEDAFVQHRLLLNGKSMRLALSLRQPLVSLPFSVRLAEMNER